MTIPNFSILTGYALWLYILICMVGVILSDHRRRKSSWRRILKLRSILAPGSVRSGAKKKTRILLRYSKNTLLLEQICRIYVGFLSKYEEDEKQTIQQRILRVLEQRIFAAEHLCAEERCTLLRCISLTGLRSDVISEFLIRSDGGSELEHRWASAALERQQEAETI